MALDSTKIKSKTTLDAVLNKLGKNNQVLIRWIPVHSGYLGNEKTDTLANRGANNTDVSLLIAQSSDSQSYLGRGNKRKDET